jgi:glutamyl-tRNA(Gln) amidotransferase subunit E
LGNELANYVKVRAGIPGIIHSDENLQKYRLESEFEKLGKEFKAKEGDTIIILSADRNIAQRTAKALEERINQLLDGVPREVRKALPDGDTEFLRPLPGAARMYPETDVPPIKINTEMLSRIQKNLPESWDRKMSRLSRSYRVPSELASQIVHSGMDDMFERLAKKHDPKLVSTTLLSTMKELGREGCDTSRITEGHLDSLFRLYKSGKIAKEAVQGILRKTCEKPDSRIDEIVKNMGVKGMDVDELEDIVRKLLASKKDLLKHPRREKILMGLVMKEVRGRIDGKTVMGVLSRELKKIK